MRIPCIAAMVLVGAKLLAQSPPSPCPADRPVDEIIAEIKDQQSKKKNRNKNPFSPICIAGYCIGTEKTPPTFPEPTPRVETSGRETETVSSSKPAVDDCRQALALAVEAAHNVEVGDYYFEKKSYNAALSRYKAAAEQKAGDAAIHVRLGRAFEKSGDLQQALREYRLADKIASPEKWSQEARAAVSRLQQQP